ncbi:helix-turn-helix transcriptional regulator [Streptomyces sp. NPDC048696]|uniref:helix-turn-helix transcriptional regulator n=1 Tax=Streptomyces sp. NPDC048696 TaxID=3365585 RepID=UPI0037218D0B
MAVNRNLKEGMSELGLKQEELAERMNDAIEQMTGKRGTVSTRTIHNLVTGKTLWPQLKQRLALEAVFGCSAIELGFVPRGHIAALDDPQHDQPEDHVLRRTFFTSTTGTVLAVTSSAAATSPPHRVGISDVRRLNAHFARIIATDNSQGGTDDVEHSALDYAHKALGLQQAGSASQRVRAQLYSLAAAFTGSAMWAAIDGGRLHGAETHLDRAVKLAGLSGDPAVQFRVWGHAGALYRHLGQYDMALAADEAAKSSRVARDPMYASLAHARTAVHHAERRETAATLRSLGYAQAALDRADPTTPRPPWMAFYDRAELHLLALTATTTLGRWEEAEAHAHQALTRLRPEMKRNHALALALLAHAQLGQRESELAVTTAAKIPAQARHGRTARLLNAFGHRLHVLAPTSPATRNWFEKEPL